MVPLLSDGDLLIAALSLNFCGSLVRAQPQEAQAAVERVLPPTLALTKSPLLQVGLPATDLWDYLVVACIVACTGKGRTVLQAAGLHSMCRKGSQAACAAEPSGFSPSKVPDPCLCLGEWPTLAFAQGGVRLPFWHAAGRCRHAINHCALQDWKSTRCSAAGHIAVDHPSPPCPPL